MSDVFRILALSFFSLFLVFSQAEAQSGRPQSDLARLQAVEEDWRRALHDDALLDALYELIEDHPDARLLFGMTHGLSFDQSLKLKGDTERSRRAFLRKYLKDLSTLGEIGPEVRAQLLWEAGKLRNYGALSNSTPAGRQNLIDDRMPIVKRVIERLNKIETDTDPRDRDVAERLLNELREGRVDAQEEWIAALGTGRSGDGGITRFPSDSSVLFTLTLAWYAAPDGYPGIQGLMGTLLGKVLIYGAASDKEFAFVVRAIFSAIRLSESADTSIPAYLERGFRPGILEFSNSSGGVGDHVFVSEAERFLEQELSRTPPILQSIRALFRLLTLRVPVSQDGQIQAFVQAEAAPTAQRFLEITLTRGPNVFRELVLGKGCGRSVKEVGKGKRRGR